MKKFIKTTWRKMQPYFKRFQSLVKFIKDVHFLIKMIKGLAALNLATLYQFYKIVIDFFGGGGGLQLGQS